MKRMLLLVSLGLAAFLVSACQRAEKVEAVKEETKTPTTTSAAATSAVASTNRPATLATAAAPAAAATPPVMSKNTNEVAIIKTSAGEMVVEFWPDVAPNTVENFKKLARQGFYDGTASHRLIRGFMIQLGDPYTKDPSKEAMWGQGDPGYKIKAEFNERKHERGVLSMARSADPDSAGSQFFICFNAQPGLDGQYTTFGKLIKGEEVLAKLETTPCGPGRDGAPSKPLQRVGVESIKIVPADSIK
jgi:peptidyl-prolyl cis-trans isomerase B (cyclophilin B)